ncbi:hypothetical protein V8E53_008660 [Lactarius tabidus]
MSIEPGTPYRITNRLAQLDLYLSVENQESVIGQKVGTEDHHTWIFDAVGNGCFMIRSAVNGLYIGFRGLPMPERELIVGDRDVAKEWLITLDKPDFKIRLANSEDPFVMEFPKNNLQPGTFARLGINLPILPVPMPTNQTWTFTKLD